MRQVFGALVALGLLIASPMAVQAAAPKASAAIASEYTGLVVDARGLDYAPCMSPRFFDQSAHDLLEGVKFDPDKVVNDGLARWVRAYNPSEFDARIGRKPLVLKPLKLDGDRLIFDDADAQKLRTAGMRSKVLERMRIVIVF